MWQIIGTISLAIVLLLGLAILLRNPHDRTRSISSFIATKPHYFLAMALALSIAGAAFYGFLVFWLVPTYEMPTITYWILGIAFAAQLCVAWTPSSSSKHAWKNSIHTVGGIIVGCAMVICIWLLVLYGSNLSPVGHTMATIAAINTSVCFVLLSIGLWRYKQLVLISEVALISVFSTALLVLCWA